LRVLEKSILESSSKHNWALKVLQFDVKGPGF